MYDRPDYRKYSLDELYDVCNVVDRNKYPDNFQAIVNEIEKRKANLEHIDSGTSKVEPISPTDKINLIIRRINKIYFVLIIMGLLYVIFTASGIWDKFGLKDSAKGLLGLIINLIAFLGLKYKKNWVVPYALIMSSFSFINMLIIILRPADQLAILIGKLFGVCLLFFYAYQIRFFSRREVKRHLESGGVELFNI